METPTPTPTLAAGGVRHGLAPRPLLAIGFMVLTGLLFVGVTAAVKHLGGRLPAAQAAFLRYLLGFVFLLPLLPSLLRTQIGARQWRMFAIRGLAHSLGVMLWFYAMVEITIAEVTAMNYLSPVYVTLGAALFLGERLQIRRILAVVAGLTGAMIILRPGLRALEPGHLAMLATTLLFAGSSLFAKRMTDTVRPSLIVVMLGIFVTIGLAPFAIAVWQPVSVGDLLWLLLIGALATGGHYTMTLAFRFGPMSVTQPITFLQLVWAVLLGTLVFGEPVDLWVIVGGLLILASVSFIAWREAWLRAHGGELADRPRPDQNG